MCATSTTVYLCIERYNHIGIANKNMQMIKLLECFLKDKSDFNPKTLFLWSDDILFCAGEHS